jgi:hypothetical protein
MRCPKCEGLMETGFIPEVAHPTLLVSSWYPGAPKETDVEVFGVKVSKWLDIDWKAARPVTAHRCESCGFIELYAR